MKPLRLILTLAVVAFTGARPGATVLVPATLDDLVSDAHVIVVGRVAEVRTQWADGRRRVESIVVVEAETYLKGDYGPQLVFKVPGGAMGRYRSVVAGGPVFRDGDEVVLFLAADGPALPHLVGFSQGVLRLARDPDTGRRLVLSPPPPAAHAAAQPVTRGDPSRRSVTVEAFATNVRSIATAVRERRDGNGRDATPSRVIKDGARPVVR